MNFRTRAAVCDFCNKDKSKVYSSPDTTKRIWMNQSPRLYEVVTGTWKRGFWDKLKGKRGVYTDHKHLYGEDQLTEDRVDICQQCARRIARDN